MSKKITERRVFICKAHQFVIECAVYGEGKGGKASVRRSPGRRANDCCECDDAVNEALVYVTPRTAT
jgi:hypothetical protein